MAALELYPVEYGLALEDFNSRNEDQARIKVIDYFNGHITRGRHIRNILIVGPDDATLESELLRGSMPDVVKIYIVEKNPNAVPKAIANLQSSVQTKCQVHPYNTTIQDYQHTGPTLDLILLSHVLYYFVADTKSILTKLKSWLTDDGVILVLADENPLVKEREAFLRSSVGICGDSVHSNAATVEAIMRSIGLQTHVEEFQLGLDTHEKRENKWIELILMERLTKQQILELMEIIKRMREPGSKCITFNRFIVCGINCNEPQTVSYDIK